jgi:hypothetical protein
VTSLRKTALVAGLLYLATFVSSIPAVFLQGPILSDPTFILGTGSTTLVRFGALLDLVNGLTAIGTAVALYSVVKRQHEGLAIGFVASRLFEAAALFVGIASMLAIVTLRESGAGAADPATLVTVQHTLVAVRDWSFVLGTAVPALNAVLLGTLMYRSRLVPRVIPALGLVGAPVFSSFIIGYILGVTESGTAWHAIGVAPIFLWELFLGLWMTFKGFSASSPLAISDAASRVSSVQEQIASPASATAQAGAA